jgi:hypothetical protein
MLALILADAVGVVLFGVLYAVAGADLMPQPAFLASLVAVFALVTTLWVRTEARHGGLEPLARFGRAAFSLVALVVATPMLVLMPLFWLDTQLPPEAGLRGLLAPSMTLVLISLVLVALSNVTGGVVIAGRALAARYAQS